MTPQPIVEETAVTHAPTLNLDAAQASALLADARLLGALKDDRSASTRVLGAAGMGQATEEAGFLTTGTATMLVAERAAKLGLLYRRGLGYQGDDPIERANAERVELLARRYVANERYSNEERARLAIVTERVRKLLPAVTAAEYEALEQHLEALQRLSAANERIRAKLRR
jgi:hypothetical protein